MTIDSKMAQDALDRWGDSEDPKVIDAESYSAVRSIMDYCLELEERIKWLEKALSKLQVEMERM